MIRIVTDTSSDFDAEEFEQAGIEMWPFRFLLD